MSELSSVEHLSGVPLGLPAAGVGPRKETSGTSGGTDAAPFLEEHHAPEIGSQAMESMVTDLNSVVSKFGNKIRFDMSDDEQLLIQVVDRESDEIIRTIPPEKLIEIQAKIGEAIGLIFDEEM